MCCSQSDCPKTFPRPAQDQLSLCHSNSTTDSVVELLSSKLFSLIGSEFEARVHSAEVWPALLHGSAQEETSSLQSFHCGIGWILIPEPETRTYLQLGQPTVTTIKSSQDEFLRTSAALGCLGKIIFYQVNVQVNNDLIWCSAICFTHVLASLSLLSLSLSQTHTLTLIHSLSHSLFCQSKPMFKLQCVKTLFICIKCICLKSVFSRVIPNHFF